MYEGSIYPQLSTERDVDLIVSRRRMESFPLHWHDYFEIEIIIDGRGKHLLNGKEYPLGVGSAYLLKPTDYHSIEADGEIEVWNVTFREGLLNEAMQLSLLHSDGLKLQTLEGERMESALMAMRLLDIECRGDGEYKRQMLEYLLHFFVDKRSKKLNRQQLSGINKALIYMEFHFREPITLGMLAKEAGFNPTYFSELFKQTTGESFIDKLNSLRLEYACTLLANNYSVSYACFESGFGSMSNFFTAFKKRYGMSPKEYASERALER